ncbi:MAG TPA: retropepsin-like aspartic protease [Longimicrobiales bacterium]|nr:retropepsin-like aspartic protease [Longimicrobiales bacterium]
MKPFLLLAISGLAAACQPGGAPSSVNAPADSAAGEVALETIGPGGAAVVVPVHINGRGPFNLVLDTGATFTCVTVEVADQLDLPEQRGVVGFGAGVHTTGRVRLVRYDSVRVGGATAHDMGGCVLDLTSLESIGTSIDGLLGLNFLREFDVRLDFQRNVLTLAAPGDNAAGPVTDP